VFPSPFPRAEVRYNPIGIFSGHGSAKKVKKRGFAGADQLYASPTNGLRIQFYFLALSWEPALLSSSSDV